MDLTPYVNELRLQLAVAADAGGDDARALAERLAAPLDSAARLALLKALSAAMEEVTRDLAPGSVDVRLRGLDPEFVVTPPPSQEAYEGPAVAPERAPSEAQVPVAPTPSDSEEAGAARINFRLPAHLKSRAEGAASQEGLSVNAWLVRVVATALETGDEGRAAAGRGRGRGRGGQGFTGWVR